MATYLYVLVSPDIVHIKKIFSVKTVNHYYFKYFQKALKAQRCLRSCSCVGLLLVNKSKMRELSQSHRFLLFTNSAVQQQSLTYFRFPNILSKTSLRVIKILKSREIIPAVNQKERCRCCAELVCDLNGWEFTNTKIYTWVVRSECISPCCYSMK